VLRGLILGLSAAALVHGGAARAQSIVRDGPGASNTPITNSGQLDSISILNGATINAASNGAAILNTPAGSISPPPGAAPASIGIDSSTLGGSVVNRGTISGNALTPISIGSSTINGGVANYGTINAFEAESAIDIVDSRLSGGFVNEGDILSSGPEVLGGPISIRDSRVSGGFNNSGSISGAYFQVLGGTFVGGFVNSGEMFGVDLEADSFSGGIVNLGSIQGVARFSPVAPPALSVAGVRFDGAIVNTGRLIGGILFGASPFTGSIVATTLTGNVVNEGDISGGEFGLELLGGSLDGKLVNRRGADISGITGISVGAVMGQGLYNAGLISGITNGAISSIGLVPRGIVVGPDGRIEGAIVNAGIIQGGFDTDTGQVVPGATAIDLTKAGAPTVIANKGGLIRGKVLMNQSQPKADTLLAEGGLIRGDVRGDYTDTLLVTPGSGGMVIRGAVVGFGNIDVNSGRTVVNGPINSSGFVGIGLVAGRPATLQLGTGQISHIGLLGVTADGTLATEVTATGEVGRVVAKQAFVRGTLELDLQPGNYGATTVYNDVVTAPKLGTTPGTTLKRVTTNTPGFKATVTYDNGTADVTLKRTSSVSVAAGRPKPQVSASPASISHNVGDPVGAPGAARPADSDGSNHPGVKGSGVDHGALAGGNTGRRGSNKNASSGTGEHSDHGGGGKQRRG
jgi:hypothetical protein